MRRARQRHTDVGCHSDAITVAAPGCPVVALVGSPNVGKSTLFNALTGLRRQVGNWPGTSVEVGQGSWTINGNNYGNDNDNDNDNSNDYGNDYGGGGTLALVDLPGAYSLDPVSPDEALTFELLVEPPGGDRPDVVVVVADAPNLPRSLYLLAQVRELPVRAVLAVTMADVAERRGITVDTGALCAATGVPVVLVDGRHRRSTHALEHAVVSALRSPPPQPVVFGQPDDQFAAADERFAWVEHAAACGISRAAVTHASWSDRLDRFACAPVAGPLLFLAAMWVVFQVTTTVAAPLQDALGSLVTGPVSRAVTAALRVASLDGTW
ncbi:MAG: FeoB small GTPase domain-containing protein, partial [Actinomycetota bacterium]|nr:FeoB small GTPase domain-containing protein [Actinomycetota bacterium]